MTTTVENYLEKQYQIVLTPEYGEWTAVIPDLPGCMAVGETIEAALELLQDAKLAWIMSALEDGDAIPEPAADRQQPLHPMAG